MRDQHDRARRIPHPVDPVGHDPERIDVETGIGLVQHRERRREHLVDLPNGRAGWRVSIPAMMSYWSELARPITLPPKTIPTTLVRAARTDPPYVSDELLAGLGSGTDFTLVDFDCDHMVAQALPADTSALIRKHLER